MSIRTKLTVDEIKEIFFDVLEDFKKALIEELKQEVLQSLKVVQADDPIVRTSDVCRRWGRSRTTLSKLIRAKKLTPAGKYGRSFTFRTSDIERLLGRSVL
ncbi:MAG: helix-turn-helix domain-containing protein [Cytophagales bacterium]|jgi:predicted DNA-binding transcriptional regulator AlpA|nr:helix-turn-helix domain-containing protein [Cytophagales bacterium]